MAGCILNTGTRWNCVISFMPQILYPQGKSPLYPLDGNRQLYHIKYIITMYQILKARTELKKLNGDRILLNNVFL
jgi:hypothetical protein